MMERDVGSAYIILRRKEGITVADKLQQFYPPRKKGLFRKTLEPQTLPESVDLLFESIPICEVTRDKTHVLAVGDDGERLYLIRDKKILYTASKKEVSGIELLQQGKDYNYLMFRTDYQTGGGAINIVNPDGEIRTPLIYSVQGRLITGTNEDTDNTIRWSFFWYKTNLLAARDADTTRLVVCDGEGNVVRSIAVPEVHDVTNISVKGTDESFSKIVWQAYPLEEEAKLGAHSYAYLNDKLLSENPGYQQVKCSPDLARVLIWTKDPLRISMNGQDILEEESGKIIDFTYNKDLTVAAFTIKTEREEGVRIFYVTPEGTQVYDELFEDVKGIRVGRDNLIHAEVIRNDVPWDLTISPPRQPSVAVSL